MDPIKMTMQEFLTKVAIPRGMTVDDVERNCKGKLGTTEDFKIFIGPRSDEIHVTLASIKEYFDAKARPKPVAPAPDPDMLTEFMAEDPKIPPAEEKKSGARK